MKQNESRKLEIDGNAVGGSGGSAYLIVEFGEIWPGEEQAGDLAMLSLESGANAVAINIAQPKEAAAWHRAATKARLGTVLQVFSARGLYNAMQEHRESSALQASVTALADSLMLSEVQSTDHPLLITASDREFEELWSLYPQLCESKKNVCLMWEAGEGDRQVNLRRISELRENFVDAVVGFVAPQEGELHAIGAVTLGAGVVQIKAPIQQGQGEGRFDAMRLKEALSDLRRVSQVL